MSTIVVHNYVLSSSWRKSPMCPGCRPGYEAILNGVLTDPWTLPCLEMTVGCLLLLFWERIRGRLKEKSRRRQERWWCQWMQRRMNSEGPGQSGYLRVRAFPLVFHLVSGSQHDKTCFTSLLALQDLLKDYSTPFPFSSMDHGFTL